MLADQKNPIRNKIQGKEVSEEILQFVTQCDTSVLNIWNKF